jgi:hypothetical protein
MVAANGSQWQCGVTASPRGQAQHRIETVCLPENAAEVIVNVFMKGAMPPSWRGCSPRAPVQFLWEIRTEVCRVVCK